MVLLVESIGADIGGQSGQEERANQWKRGRQGTAGMLADLTGDTIRNSQGMKQGWRRDGVWAGFIGIPFPRTS